jgi:hypothetical protein
MFPVRYELNFYINLLRNSVFKGLTLLLCSAYHFLPSLVAPFPVLTSLLLAVKQQQDINMRFDRHPYERTYIHVQTA